MKFEIPIRTVSVANARENWGDRAKRVTTERKATRQLFRSARVKQAVPRFPLVVSLTRVGPQDLDSDNLPVSMKSIRDQLADELGLPNDNDPRVTWAYAQERGTHCVRIAIEASKAVQTSAREQEPSDAKKVIDLRSGRPVLQSEKSAQKGGSKPSTGHGKTREVRAEGKLTDAEREWVDEVVKASPVKNELAKRSTAEAIATIHRAMAAIRGGIEENLLGQDDQRALASHSRNLEKLWKALGLYDKAEEEDAFEKRLREMREAAAAAAKSAQAPTPAAPAVTGVRAEMEKLLD